MSHHALRARAYAKINIGLRVMGTRPDGFHELRTVFQTLELHDTLTLLRRRGAMRLRCTAAGLPLDETNLVMRAGQLLWRRLGRDGAPRGVEVVLEKRIPVGGGLGGGSSDAAAALRALAVAWRARLPFDELADIASELGADVPFFLTGGAALGLGRGDELYPLAAMAPTWVVVLVPAFSVRTADAYQWLDADRAGTSPRARRVPPSRKSQANGSAYLTPTDVWNDLQQPVAARHPDIARMRRALEASGASLAAMSGSGSSVFGLFPTERAAASAFRLLRRTRWTPIVTRVLERRRYLKRGAVQRLRRLPPSVLIG